MPSSTSSVAATQAGVMSAVSQAFSQSALVAAGPIGTSPFTTTYACAAGGTITSTMSVPSPPGPSGSLTMSSRLEFNACQTANATLQGDPYIDTSSEYSTIPGANGAMTISMTSQMTGGVRFTSNGVQGRAQYACAIVTTMQFASAGSGTPQITTASSGSITWEQPLGATPTSRSCGPQ
jgi:hypothetical protein